MRSGRYLHVSAHLLISSIDCVAIARSRLLFCHVGISQWHTNRVHRVQSYIVFLALISNLSFCQAVRLLKRYRHCRRYSAAEFRASFFFSFSHERRAIY